MVGRNADIIDAQVKINQRLRAIKKKNEPANLFSDFKIGLFLLSSAHEQQSPIGFMVAKKCDFFVA